MILQVSSSATGLLYVSILLLLIGGVWAGFSGDRLLALVRVVCSAGA